MDTSDGIDLSALVGLEQIGAGATAAELRERLRQRAELSPSDVSGLIALLVRRGLIRPGGARATEPRYLPTPLGAELLSQVTRTGRVLEEIEQRRSDLLAIISHELRTPLTAVRTAAGLLREPTVDTDRALRERLIDTIADNADRMQTLIADILDLARFRGGDAPLQLRRFDAAALAREAASSIEPLLLTRGQQLDLRLPPRPIWVYADHRRLEQVLLNLLSNAVKFSPTGSTVTLEVSRGGQAAVWRVADEGPGISAEHRARLFDRFFTLSPREGGAQPSGTGLGLPLARAIVEAHAGSLTVESVPGRGSTFTVSVPVRGPAGREEA